MDRNVYQDLVGTSSVQSQKQKYLEDRKTQYTDMTHVPRRFYGQVTYSYQKQAYIFVENDVIDPIENGMYVILP